MLTDYKFWYIKRDDEGFITEATVRFYEGEIAAKTVKVEKSIGVFEDENVVRYWRSKQLSSKDLEYLEVPVVKEQSGNECAVFIDKDFGKIKTTDELRSFLNKELAKDPKRTPIDEQK